MGSVHLESSLDPALGRQRSYSLSPRHWDIDHLESDRCDLSSPPSRGFIFAPDSFLYPPLSPSTEFTHHRRARGELIPIFPLPCSPQHSVLTRKVLPPSMAVRTSTSKPDRSPTGQL